MQRRSSPGPELRRSLPNTMVKFFWRQRHQKTCFIRQNTGVLLYTVPQCCWNPIISICRATASAFILLAPSAPFRNCSCTFSSHEYRSTWWTELPLHYSYYISLVLFVFILTFLIRPVLKYISVLQAVVQNAQV